VLCLAENTQHQILVLPVASVCGVYVVSLLSILMNGACCPWHENLNSWYDNEL